jgi:hypothetical protein
MTVLSACQSAMLRLGGGKPSTVFSSQNQMEMEIADLATDVATDIMKSHDWRDLTVIETFTPDGVTATFPKPSDYDRMVLAEDIEDGSNWLWGYTPVDSLSDWIRITTSGFSAITPGWWIILGGQFQFSPAPSVGSPAVFPYISKNFGRTAAGGAISAFANDSDRFVLNERLLTLGIIWRYKAQKGLEYAEDMASFEKALSEEAARDKGSRVIRKGRPSAHLNTRAAWPWPLG